MRLDRSARVPVDNFFFILHHWQAVYRWATVDNSNPVPIAIGTGFDV